MAEAEKEKQMEEARLKQMEEAEKEKQREEARLNRIAYLADSLKSEKKRLTCDEDKSLVNVLETKVDCSKFKEQFRECVIEKGDRDECKHEFLLYAMCKMKQESEGSNEG